MIVTALFFESLAGVLFLSLDSLKLSKILTIWEVTPKFILMGTVGSKVRGLSFYDELPLLLKHVALL